MRGWEETANEQYPLLSTACPLFFCFVFRVPLSLSANHYVHAMRRIKQGENCDVTKVVRKEKRNVYYFTTQYYSVQNDALYKYHQFYSVFTIAFYGFA